MSDQSKPGAWLLECKSIHDLFELSAVISKHPFAKDPWAKRRGEIPIHHHHFESPDTDNFLITENRITNTAFERDIAEYRIYFTIW